MRTWHKNEGFIVREKTLENRGMVGEFVSQVEIFRIVCNTNKLITSQQRDDPGYLKRESEQFVLVAMCSRSFLCD